MFLPLPHRLTNHHLGLVLLQSKTMAFRERDLNVITPHVNDEEGKNPLKKRGKTTIADKENMRPAVDGEQFLSKTLFLAQEMPTFPDPHSAFDLPPPPGFFNQHSPSASVGIDLQKVVAEAKIRSAEEYKRRMEEAAASPNKPIESSRHNSEQYLTRLFDFPPQQQHEASLSKESIYKLEPLGPAAIRKDTNGRFSSLRSAVMHAGGQDAKADLEANIDTLNREFCELFGLNHEEDVETPTRDQYFKTIQDLCYSKQEDNVLEALGILESMCTDYLNVKNAVQPDGAFYNTVIHALADMKKPVQAENLLIKMWEDYYAGNKRAKPNVRIYTSVLHAWQKSDLENAPWRCEILLEQMQSLYDSGHGQELKPDVFSYTACLHSWANSRIPVAPENAMKIFRRLKKKYTEGDASLCPDRLVYSNLMNAFARSSLPPHRTSDIFWEMVDDYLGGNPKAKPTIRNFNTALAVWSRSQQYDAPDRAEEMLQKLKEYNSKYSLCILPDNFSYSLLLKTWAHSKRNDSAYQTELTLMNFMKLYQQGDEAAKPDIIKCTTVLSALAHSKKPESAQRLLMKIVEDHKRGIKYCMPDQKCFNIVMSAWSRSDSENAPMQCDKLLNYMWKLVSEGMVHLVPDLWSYKTLLFCWKKHKSPREADRVLVEIFTLHNKGVLSEGPDKAAYDAVIQSWLASTHAKRCDRVNYLRSRMGMKTNMPLQPFK